MLCVVFFILSMSWNSQCMQHLSLNISLNWTFTITRILNGQLGAKCIYQLVRFLMLEPINPCWSPRLDKDVVFTTNYSFRALGDIPFDSEVSMVISRIWRLVGSVSHWCSWTLSVLTFVHIYIGEYSRVFLLRHKKLVTNWKEKISDEILRISLLTYNKFCIVTNFFFFLLIKGYRNVMSVYASTMFHKRKKKIHLWILVCLCKEKLCATINLTSSIALCHYIVFLTSQFIYL